MNDNSVFRLDREGKDRAHRHRKIERQVGKKRQEDREKGWMTLKFIKPYIFLEA